MKDVLCSSCRRPKSEINCELCSEPLCKGCAQYVEGSTFAFYREIPDTLAHTYYCPACYDREVSPALESYHEIMERAQALYVFFKTQRKPLPIIKRSKESVQVDECDDRDETILRLAFLAAEQGYNAIIETEVTSEKIRNAGYQKSRWKGIATPAQINTEKLERRS